MSRWRQIRAFLYVDLLDTVRFWHISLFTVALTSFYYLMLVGFTPAHYRRDMTVAFVVLAVLGLTLFQFSTRASAERLDTWQLFVRTLPAPDWVRFAARFLLVLVLAHLSGLVLVAAGILRFDLTLDSRTVTTMVLAVPISAAVFAPFGACLGGFLHPRVVPAIITVLYLFTAWSGGLWSGGRPPEVVTGFDAVLPFFAVLRLATALAAGDWAAAIVPAAVSLGWAGAGIGVALVIYRRDEGEIFR